MVERGQGGRAGVHTTVLWRRAAHLTVSVRLVCGAMDGGHRVVVWQAVGGWGHGVVLTGVVSRSH